MRQRASATLLTRRRFRRGAVAAAAAATSLGAFNTFPAAPPAEFKHKLKLGVIGNGGRDAWIAGLFQKHGGREMFAVADCFPAVAGHCGDALGMDRARHCATLSGYKQLIKPTFR